MTHLNIDVKQIADFLYKDKVSHVFRNLKMCRTLNIVVYQYICLFMKQANSTLNVAKKNKSFGILFLF